MNRTSIAVSALMGAALALPLLSTSAQAQSYSSHSHYRDVPSYNDCMQQQRNRQITGAVIGGVLGAVIGAEIHDDRQDRDRERHYDRRHHRDHYGRRDRHRDRYHRRHRDRHYHEEGNDGAVLAGAGLGALAGSALAGRSSGCEQFAQRGGQVYSTPPSYDYDTGYSDGYRDPSPYRQSSSAPRGELLGGADYGYDEPAQPFAPSSEPFNAPYSGQSNTGARTYTARSSQPVSAGACRTMRSGNGAVTMMCQGPDGIWRPAERY